MRARLLVDVLVSRSEVRRGLRRARGAVRALRTAGHLPGSSRVLDRRLRDLGLLASMDGSLSTAVRLLRPVRSDEPDLARLLAMAPLAPLQRSVLEGRLRGLAWHEITRALGTDLGSASRALRAAVTWLSDTVRVHDALAGGGEVGVHDLGAVARSLRLSRRRVNAIAARMAAGPAGDEEAAAAGEGPGGGRGGGARGGGGSEGPPAGTARCRRRPNRRAAAARRAESMPPPDPVQDDEHPANTPNPSTVAKPCPSSGSAPPGGSALSAEEPAETASCGWREASDPVGAAAWFILAVRPGCALRVKVEIEERLPEVHGCCVPPAAGYRGATGLRGSYVAVQARLDAALVTRIRQVPGVLGVVGLPGPAGRAGGIDRGDAGNDGVAGAPPVLSDAELRAFLGRLGTAGGAGWDADAGRDPGAGQAAATGAEPLAGHDPENRWGRGAGRGAEIGRDPRGGPGTESGWVPHPAGVTPGAHRCDPAAASYRGPLASRGGRRGGSPAPSTAGQRGAGL